METDKRSDKYSPELRTFALTLAFYSFKTYNYVRSVLKNKLPISNTIHTWYSNIKGSPCEFIQEASHILKRKQKSHNRRLYTFLHACVHTHASTHTCARTPSFINTRWVKWFLRIRLLGRVGSDIEFIGYVDYELKLKSECEPENLFIDKVLVYLLNCVNQRWKILATYISVNELNAEKRVENTK